MSKYIAIAELREILDYGDQTRGPKRTQLLESVKLLNQAPRCQYHGRKDLVICAACRKGVHCAKCETDTVPCQCQYVTVMEC